MKIPPTLYVTISVISVYCGLELYLLWSVIDRPFGSSRHIIEKRLNFAARNNIEGVNIGDRLTVHLLEGDIFNYGEVMPRAWLATYSPFIPVVARYPIPDEAKENALYLIEILDFRGSTSRGLYPTLRKISSTLPIQHGAVNSLTISLKNPELRKSVWSNYLADRKIHDDKPGFGGQVFYFPVPPPVGERETAAFLKEPLSSKQAVAMVAFLTFDELPQFPKDAYLKIARRNLLSGLTEISHHIDPLGRERNKNFPMSILLPALNTPMIAYDWVGEAQALAIRELSNKLFRKTDVPIVARAEYTEEQDPSHRLHIFLVPFTKASEEERQAYVSGIIIGFLAWTNPFYSVFLLTVIPIGLIFGFALPKAQGHVFRIAARSLLR